MGSPRSRSLSERCSAVDVAAEVPVGTPGLVAVGVLVGVLVGVEVSTGVEVLLGVNVEVLLGTGVLDGVAV
jgi:hypothetical protein